MMPSLIAQKHNLFINRFNLTGQSYLLNKKTILFVKKGDGFVQPVEFSIRFHYSFEHKYTFVVTMRRVTHMEPFADGVRHSTNELLFLMVDNEEEGNV